MIVANKINKILDIIEMGEPEAIRAIKEGKVTIGNKEYNVENQPSGSCDNCDFFLLREDNELESCPIQALNICCTGGNILKEVKYVK